MGRKEKRKRKANKKKRTQSLPTDLIIEILLKLPEKSIARFSCVSKLWSSITTDPSFISSFQTRWRLLLCFQKDDNFFVSSIPQNATQNSNRSYSSSLSFDHHHTIKHPLNFNYYPSTESVHGLICFLLNKPIVWNPRTRQLLTLPTIPTPCKDWDRIFLFLGYDPIDGKHKVMCIPRKRTCYVCRVLTLGSAQESESWRTVKINHKHRSSTYTAGRCIEGVIYYLAYTCPSGDYVVMSFDVRSERFNMIKLPSDFDEELLITYKGRLAYFSEINHRIDHKRLWILEDAKKHKWSRQDFLSTFHGCPGSPRAPFNLTGFTHAGELIYVPEWFSQSFYILLCDPVKNSWRRFEFKGMADLVSIHNGVEEQEEKDRPIYELHAFPNHTDS